MSYRKLKLQAKGPKDEDWGTLNTVDLSGTEEEQARSRRTLETFRQRWQQQTEFADHAFRIV